MRTQIKNICCIGAGYVGGPTMAVIADKCPHIKVNVVDINLERIEAWNSDDLNKLPVFEPGLDEIIKRTRCKNLNFSCDIEEKIREAQMVFISVNTPTKIKGVGAGQASDLKYVEACARQVAKYAKGHTIVIEKSTLPVKTAEVIKTILEDYQMFSTNDNAKATFDVLSNPEFLAEGTAINDLENPDRVLIGGQNEFAINALSQIYSNWVPKNKILHTNIWSSELAKLTSNAFLAQRVSSINAIGALCEATGADVKEVARAIGTDSRIGSRFLDAGPGFGGSCFKKDILNLVYLSKHFGLVEVANFWEVVVSLNNWHQHRISRLVVKNLFGTVTGKKICILGFAFKANTNDTRESAAINICKDLLEEGAILFINDPKVVPEQISKDLLVNENKTLKSIESQNLFNYEGSWCSEDNLEIAASNADAIIVLTEWDEYSKIDWDLISKKMRKPAWVFDARSVIDEKKVLAADLNLWKVGNGSI
ncbi:UDP-glucose dehydrogenase [Prochlorococcus marinus str. MIT 9302]|uniref:UDP-glucose 6-dehydrogenase n=1 Tax=Prochlorococcus marinus str. MIT 9302 TaxID=74545 RepID=A0A0A2A7S7_PROMR|nr:nucleotide sugar dehydrogenase [Prochlorococcus marinus]KGF96901.1 UDP-glucose dehydrogenase [Prochlorococcus marinus str. MIT 9302]